MILSLDFLYDLFLHRNEFIARKSDAVRPGLKKINAIVASFFR